jgi:hypothetical protein
VSARWGERGRAPCGPRWSSAPVNALGCLCAEAGQIIGCCRSGVSGLATPQEALPYCPGTRTSASGKPRHSRHGMAWARLPHLISPLPPRPARYDRRHDIARARAFALLPEWPICVRGGHVMWKWAKDSHGRSSLHYDHRSDGLGYVGFSCAKHNTADGARITNARRRAQRPSASTWWTQTPRVRPRWPPRPHDAGPGPGW